uniref:Macaca fascicularis brain cDNA clone: QmoA-10924, similar to human potassium channel tetramerisation domain containing 12(KCTD12), mRNA, RefSeq: NM_138444.2 n=1 Tax=Macaca fascicularis TaxID=9541 RepID=I7G8A8_MACFA|nr:unnamed protein product [Macaca fascicularis]
MHNLLILRQNEQLAVLIIYSNFYWNFRWNVISIKPCKVKL